MNDTAEVLTNPMPPSPSEPPRTFWGHPRMVWMLFVVSIGANFAFYGFRAFLAPYVADTFFAQLSHAEAQKQATLLFAGFGSLNFALAILGGWVADNVLGEVQSLRLSLWLSIIGLLAMTVPSMQVFRLGLGFFVLATGLGIPMTVLVGRNYADNDPKRDGGYTLFYIAINFGAFFAPLICADWVGNSYGDRWGFAAAAAVQGAGALIFEWNHRKVVGRKEVPRYKRAWSTPAVIVAAVILAFPAAFLLAHPDVVSAFVALLFVAMVAFFVVKSVRRGDRVQSHRYIAFLLLFIAMVLYWAMALLSGTALNFFARDFVMPLWHGSLLGLVHWDFTLFQSANPLIIMVFGVFVAMVWPWLNKRGINPSTPRKFGIGLLLIALGFGVLWYAATYLQSPGGKVAAWTLVVYYLLSTFGELALSPIGYAMVGKLASAEEASLAMGGWFFGVALSANLAGRIATLAASGGIEPYAHVFEWLLIGGGIVAAAYLILAPAIEKLMHGAT